MGLTFLMNRHTTPFVYMHTQIIGFHGIEALWYLITELIIYLFSVNTFTPIERCAIIFIIAQVEKLVIGQKIQQLQNCARCNSSLIGQ